MKYLLIVVALSLSTTSCSSLRLTASTTQTRVLQDANFVCSGGHVSLVSHNDHKTNLRVICTNNSIIVK